MLRTELDRMQPKAISQKQLTQQLLDLGVTPESVLLVHCAFSQVKPAEEGPLGLITALLSALGPEGTLAMPSMIDEDDHPFDPQHTPCTGIGVVANTFWQLPNVLLSDSPRS
jgi:aminoglycoside 3-N-acetyltransferase